MVKCVTEWCIPRLLMLIGGDSTCIDQLLEAITHHHIPVLVCQGTGGVADFIVKVLQTTHSFG